jgi:large exoprotein involved in heme utilization and adhesion
MANVADGARISVTTSGAGNAGTITANVGTMSISGGQLDSSTSAAGNGGAINVNAGTEVSVLNGGRITGDSIGSGLTGNITIAAGNRITMTGGSISTRALTSDGGNITIRAPQVVRIENSQITTSVQSGSGAGGNIMIDPVFLLTNNSTITANAFGGPGGNITIVADNFVPSASTLIEASSALSTPENNLASSIAQLPRAFVDASRLLRGSCSARREGAPSSFTLAGRGGVPPDADSYLPSFIGSGTAAPLAFARLDYGDCAY